MDSAVTYGSNRCPQVGQVANATVAISSMRCILA